MPFFSSKIQICHVEVIPGLILVLSTSVDVHSVQFIMGYFHKKTFYSSSLTLFQNVSQPCLILFLVTNKAVSLPKKQMIFFLLQI